MKSAFVRRAELFRWLMDDHGMKYRHVRTMLESGAIVRLKVPGREKGRDLFSRAQVERDVLGVLGVK